MNNSAIKRKTAIKRKFSSIQAPGFIVHDASKMVSQNFIGYTLTCLVFD